MTPHEVQIASSHYWSREYNTKERLCSYWHQVDEALRMQARTVLEVGPGAGVVTHWLRRAGVEVTTVDHDPELNPDLTASVTAMPVGDHSFDAVVCCQVLEHLRWEEAEAAIAELARVVRTGVILSLPDASPWIGKAGPLYHGQYIENVRKQMPTSRCGVVAAMLRGQLRPRDVLWTRVVPARWGLGGHTFELSPRLVPHVPRRHRFDGQHRFELGTYGFPAARVVARLHAVGLDDVRTFRVPENPWHHFFVARRRDA
jgi:SAM-dependent methyltransferase